MDYKKIIKSRSIRLKFLRLLSFIPDVPMIKLQYRIKTGRKLDLKNPKRFTEKLQWYKLNYKNPLMIQCVDKYDVREYVKSKGLEDILIPCYGIFDSVDEINWDDLPNQFVMKDTLGGGGNSVIIVKDKKKVNIEELKRRGKEWTSIKAHVRDAGREWPYYCGKNHRIIVEKYIEAEEKEGGLIDYKYFCFDGKPTWIYVMADRNIGQSVGVGIYNKNFEKVSVSRNDERILERCIEKPENFKMMKKISSILSEDFPEARIDLYDNDGKILFGEITFYDGSGYMTFTPDSFDLEMGRTFKLIEKHKTKNKKSENSGGGYLQTLVISARCPVDKKTLEDYKFFCFNGNIEFLYVMGERVIGEAVKVGIFDEKFNLLPVKRVGDELYKNFSKPDNYEEMKRIAEILAKDFPHVRVDLYSVGNKILFGELTFYNASGYMKYEPDSFDFDIGKSFDFNEK